MNDSGGIVTASAIRFLLKQQSPDGHWEDYDLPVGSSDAWVTGYVGLALAESSTDEGVRRSYSRAAAWLEQNRPYVAGWGYNGRTGPDTDSTAFALRLLLLSGRVRQEIDLAWLRRQWLVADGFRTYDGPGSWGAAHPDVTPVAFRALTDPERARLRPEFMTCLERHRQSDGTWPSYWWRTSHYATYWTLLALTELGCVTDVGPPLVANDESHSVRTIFDLAFVIGISEQRLGNGSLTWSLARELIAHQRGDGGWPGGLNLRVTDPDCERPWEQPRGRLFSDSRGLITTASALRVLSGIRTTND